MAHVCPWWMGYFLINPLRKLFQNPHKILSPHIKRGITAVDVGSGMGYFTIPMAQLVGDNGRIIAVDLQEKMLARLNKRACKYKVDNQILAHLCSENSLDLDNYNGKIDFALAFAVMHELPDQKKILQELYDLLKDGGRILLAEPVGHVSNKEFANTADLACQIGFKKVEKSVIKRSHVVMLAK